MHTTTKKNLGRSTRAKVVGHSSVSSPLCARRIGHRALLTRARSVCACMRVWELLVCPRVLLVQRVVQTRVYQRGTLLPWTRSKLPSGTSLVQSFLLVTLPVTSTSMRYDRYDTCLHVCLRIRGPRPLRANASRIATNGAGASRFRSNTPLRHPCGNYFSRTRRDARNCKLTSC